MQRQVGRLRKLGDAQMRLAKLVVLLWSVGARVHRGVLHIRMPYLAHHVLLILVIHELSHQSRLILLLLDLDPLQLDGWQLFVLRLN